MKITPLISTDIIGRYSKRNNYIMDNFTNTIIHTKNKQQQTKIFQQLNTIGLLNANRLQNKQQMLSIIV